MLCIWLNTKDPFFCLAAEEFLLKNYTDDIFILWQSENTVVVGKHQNTLAEINYRFIRENNIHVARRISGGGTVFHDAGNVNFTFIRNVTGVSEISFSKFTKPIIESLARLGIEATTSGRNDILIGGKKISGNAEHVYKNRVLHHGTLLYNSNLENLGQAIKVIPGKYQSKAVQSNRSMVTNISAFLSEKIAVKDFISFIFNVQLENEKNNMYQLSNHEVQKIDELSALKFRGWEWNFAYSPKYMFENEVDLEDKWLKIEMIVEKGIISDANISGNYFAMGENRFFSKAISGKRHSFEEVSKVLQPSVLINENLIYSFF